MIEISNIKSSHFFRGTSLPCNNAVASRLSCNKYFLRRLLKEKRLPTPRTIILRHPAAWQTVLKSSLTFPLVVKPINASHANGASLNVTTPDELKLAVARAFAYNKKYKRGTRVLVEEFFVGHDLRFFVIGKRVVSVVKRDPAYVVGNGRDTIRQLIQSFNQEWRSAIKYDLPLCPIPIDGEVSRFLTKNNLSFNTIPRNNEKIYLRWNANVSTGGRPIDVTSDIHPRLKKLAVQIAKISHLEIGGVDILCKNYTSGNLSSENVSILEINDSPGIDIHHFPISGVGQDVATAILDHIFKAPRTAKTLNANQLKALLRDIKIRDAEPLTQNLHKLR